MPGLQFKSVAELQELVDAERAGLPFVVFRDGAGRRQIVALGTAGDEVPIGRRLDRGIVLDWDPEVSRVHAVLQPVAGAWVIVDDGLSRNGTFVNGKRLLARHRLVNRDAIRCGQVVLEFRDPRHALAEETLRAPDGDPARHRLTPAQRRVLIALCRPFRESTYSTPATNQQIADELVVSVDAVKSNLRALFSAFGVDDLPQNQKRASLALCALRTGVVSRRDL